MDYLLRSRDRFPKFAKVHDAQLSTNPTYPDFWYNEFTETSFSNTLNIYYTASRHPLLYSAVNVSYQAHHSNM